MYGCRCSAASVRQLYEAATSEPQQDTCQPAATHEVESAMALALYESCESVMKQTPLRSADPSFWSDARADAHATCLWYQALIRLHIRGRGELPSMTDHLILHYLNVAVVV